MAILVFSQKRTHYSYSQFAHKIKFSTNDFNHITFTYDYLFIKFCIQLSICYLLAWIGAHWESAAEPVTCVGGKRETWYLHSWQKAASLRMQHLKKPPFIRQFRANSLVPSKVLQKNPKGILNIMRHNSNGYQLAKIWLMVTVFLWGGG